MKLFLYKYREWTDRTKEILSNQTVYYSKPDELNDPFDCKAELFSSRLDVGFAEEIKLHHLTSFYKCYLSENSSSKMLSEVKKKHMKYELEKCKTTDAKFEYIKRFFKQTMPPTFKLTEAKDTIDSFNRQVENMGVLSLSENFKNILMWSHYAKDHTGLVLAFNIDRESLTNVLFDKVEYVKEFPKLDLKDTNQKIHYNFSIDGGSILKKDVELQMNDPNIQNVFFKKADDWLYEKEWRLLRQKYGVYAFPGKLEKIYFGCRCSNDTKKEVKTIVSEKYDYEVQYINMMIGNSSYTLEEE
ncbi:hypothetical protein AGMMS50255_4030 [Spirochaetia bacterium]|nr:hypothetical protein AGMMS50255_4030 [Spirochaetia bacterium]